MNNAILYTNLCRLKSTFEVSNRIGATENGGVNRLALTKEDKEMRDVLIKWLRDEGLTVRIDDFGNIYGRRNGKNKNAGAVMIGSHLDSMPKAGRYDGILGVLSALEVIRTLNEHNIETEHPIEIVNFTNEEGERFKPPLLGSGGVTGHYEKDFIYNIEDKDGKSYKQSLEEIGYMGKKESRLTNVEYFIEVHIEQAPFLEENNNSVGIVHGVKGSGRFKLSIKGLSSHGAFPNSHRKDALIAASEIALVINQQAEQFADLSTSIGVFDVQPSVLSQTADYVEMTFDVRHLDDEVKKQAINVIKQQSEEIANKRKVELVLTQTWEADGKHFSKNITNIMEEGANNYDYPYQYITSSALHDAAYMNDIAKTAMLFVPCLKGLSHCEEEFVSYEDIEKVTNVLLHTVKSLAK